jgi:hypothetical protein
LFTFFEIELTSIKSLPNICNIHFCETISTWMFSLLLALAFSKSIVKASKICWTSSIWPIWFWTRYRAFEAQESTFFCFLLASSNFAFMMNNLIFVCARYYCKSSSPIK